MRTPWNIGWSIIICTLLLPILSWSYFPRLVLLNDPSPSPIQKLIVASGAGVAVYLWFVLISHTIPWLVLNYRVRSAYSREDWEALNCELSKAESRNWTSDNWYATRGLALFNLGLLPEALDSFERIREPLEEAELEYARIFNYANTLAHAGRRDDARMIFQSVPLEAWPTPMKLHVDELRGYFDGDQSEPPLAN